MKNLQLINSILLKDYKTQKNELSFINKKGLFCILDLSLSKLESNFYNKLLKGYLLIEALTKQKGIILKILTQKNRKNQNISFVIGSSVRNFLKFKLLNMYYLHLIIPLSINYNQLNIKRSHNTLKCLTNNINLYVGLDENFYILNKQQIVLNLNFTSYDLKKFELKNYEKVLLQ